MSTALKILPTVSTKLVSMLGACSACHYTSAVSFQRHLAPEKLHAPASAILHALAVRPSWCKAGRAEPGALQCCGAYAKMGHHHEALFTAAAEHTARTISAFQPQSVVSS